MSTQNNVDADTVTVQDLQELRAALYSASPLAVEIDKLILTVIRCRDQDAVRVARTRCAELVNVRRRENRENREIMMFGCTEATIDIALMGKEPRDIAMYAMSALSDAQEMLARTGSVEHERRADTVRQLINLAKYAINKAVPR